MKYTADEIIKSLGFAEHYEGGYYKFIWKSGLTIPKGLLPPTYNNDRKLCSVIYYLLKPGQESSWHKLTSDEFWFWHYGGALEMTIGSGCDNPVEEEKIIIGPDILQGQSFQAHVMSGKWQTTKPLTEEFCLVSCVVSPGFEEDDFYFPKGHKNKE